MNGRNPVRHITPEVITRFQSEKLLQGNGTAAVAVLEPSIKNKQDRAWQIQRRADKSENADYVPKAIQQIAVKAIDRVGEVVNGTDDGLALKASMFVIDHAIGKAVQRNDNVNVNLNIESVLE